MKVYTTSIDYKKELVVEDFEHFKHYEVGLMNTFGNYRKQCAFY